MVKSSKSKKRKNRKNKEARKNPVKSRKINASTAYDTCTEQLSPFGGVLPLIKFFDLIGFRESFDSVLNRLHANPSWVTRKWLWAF